ncbi:MAG TPA: cob(I)yrinic acid a,c-diamide adenosyltransferase [Bacteroidota bacterium]|nr:cob(I)yrinic acid a,c-diamide adenosyltransferase [Candidatus Kapabacteria bacterium]HRS00932.1 cob(I)yrinic acid a,c-diamide adenosyltransferase [Bacteroidota bacterium]
MKIYTKTGDNGETSLNSKDRISKSNIRVEAYGTIDELNSLLGIIMTEEILDVIKIDIEKIMNLLFQVGSDLATPFNSTLEKKITRIEQNDILFLETKIDYYTAELPELHNFILPYGTKQSALLYFARAVTRRAERRIVALSEIEEINPNIIIFINRLSDYLFIAARYINFKLNIEEKIWKV